MEVVIARDALAVGEIAAGIVAARLAEGNHPVIGLATGNSPLTTYRALIDHYCRGEVSFAEATAVSLDEYVGLTDGHPQTYRSVIRRDFVDHIDLPLDRLHSPQVDSNDLDAACTAYEELVIGLNVDVQLLGIGSNGHVAFNEPGSSLASRTRVKTLSDRTRRDNRRFFASLSEVPRHVVTQGVATLSHAKHLLMLACGSPKAAPIAAAIEGPVTAMCPASVLQMHPRATVIIDEMAAANLQLIDYYRETHRHKLVSQPS